jgi:replicative DNA helicase
MSAGFKFISKMLDSKNVDAFSKYGIDAEKFPTPEEREVFRYLEYYIRENRTLPSPEELSAKFEDFVYIPNVACSFDTLAKELNGKFIQMSLARLVQGNVGADDEFAKRDNLSSLINEKDGYELIEWLADEVDKIKQRINSNQKIGHNIKTDFDWFLDEYERRKQGKTFKVFPSRFPSLNKIMGGGYSTGNMYTWFGRSGRGKSIIALIEAITAAINGATVLYWGLEMPKYELYARAYSSLSARRGIFTAQIDGIDYEVGFPQRDILMAKMSPTFYHGFKNFVKTIDQQMKGTIIFRCIDDEDFMRRDLRELEFEIRQTGADVVVIDPAYYMDMEFNSSKTAGGDMAATSKKLRLMAGNLGVVLHVITQAEETKDQYAEDGERVLTPPKRNEVKKSKQLLEDASLTIGIDTKDGQGVIVPAKGRNGGEDEKIDIVFLPNYGLVQEMPSAEEAEEKFTVNF